MGLAFYFALGFVLEALIVWYYLSIQQHRAVSASLLGIGITMLNLFVIAEIVVSKRILLIGSFILGQALGTFLGMKVRIGANHGAK